MLFVKQVQMFFVGASICAAQTINISGIVKGSDGEGISGASVKFEHANIVTETSEDGYFSLTASNAKRSTPQAFAIAASTIRLQNGKQVISLTETAPVSVSVFDMSERLEFNSKRIFRPGKHSIPISLQTTGIRLVKVFRSVASGLTIFMRRESRYIGKMRF